MRLDRHPRADPYQAGGRRQRVQLRALADTVTAEARVPGRPRRPLEPLQAPAFAEPLDQPELEGERAVAWIASRLQIRRAAAAEFLSGARHGRARSRTAASRRSASPSRAAAQTARAGRPRARRPAIAALPRSARPTPRAATAGPRSTSAGADSRPARRRQPARADPGAPRAHPSGGARRCRRPRSPGSARADRR